MGKKKKPVIIGEYEILKQIGEGGFAYTYLGRHTVLKNCFACVKQNIELDDEDRAILLKEAELLWKIDFYCLPSLRACYKLDDGSIVIVMRFVDGAELYKLKEAMYPEGIDPEAICWMTQRLLETLRYLHSMEVIHGDIKPQNIILEESGEYPGYASHAAWLVDFGLATLKPRRMTRCPGYTPAFAAPEQLDGKPPIPETDVYGLGATMIHALGGDIGSMTMPPTVPRKLREFFSRMVVRQPLKRPGDLGKIQRELSDLRKELFGGRASGKPFRIK
ncbi:MAG: serine/threonine-protein kinase [Patescibacteria group bacterium]